jgi:hypothetical protein
MHLLRAMRTRGLSGVGLKDETEQLSIDHIETRDR